MICVATVLGVAILGKSFEFLGCFLGRLPARVAMICSGAEPSTRRNLQHEKLNGINSNTYSTSLSVP
eukprot:1287455-Amphidinium_carterae.1